MKKGFVSIGVLLGVLALAAAGLFAGHVYRTEYREAAVCTYLSPDGAYVLEVRSVGEPDFPFGSAHVRMRLKNGGKELCRADAEIANDGGWARESDRTTSAIGGFSSVRVTVHSEEAPDAVYRMASDGAVIQEKE